MIYYFDSKNPKAPAQMGRLLTDMVIQKILPHQEIVILCIGSDRSTGDSLGPIIGHAGTLSGNCRENAARKDMDWQNC